MSEPRNLAGVTLPSLRTLSLDVDLDNLEDMFDLPSCLQQLKFKNFEVIVHVLKVREEKSGRICSFHSGF